MDTLLSYLPAGDKGLLPYYLFIVGIVSIGNSIQNITTLHYTRRIYNGLFVRNGNAVSEDSVNKLVPTTTPTDKKNDDNNSTRASDQITPLAARLFGSWTMLAGFVRLYTAHDVSNPALYKLSLITHVIAAAHFGSEALIFRTMRVNGPQLFPLAAGFLGSFWMALQYSHYVQ